MHASQIVVRTEEEGREILSALKRRADFAALARTRSLGPEASRGGDLGWFEAGVMPRVFDEVCFSLKPGELSKLTPSEYGFHIFKVHEKKPERTLTLEEAQKRLHTRLLHNKLQRAEAAYVKNLRERYRVVVMDKRLDAVEKAQ